ncbi:hypothetical protein [Luteolibacter sp. Populi]|uniref:hypothetical protein n=1 Tax=Luteolibacter sp. Populi TaxID=3230487 RepID=UPI003465EA86
MNEEASTKKSKAGRKPKITPEVQAKLEAYLRAGNLVKTACAAAGIDQSTFYLWKRRGNEDRNAGKRTRYFQFIESIGVALAEGEVLLVAEVRKGGARGALEILKRLHRERWGDKVAVNQTPNGAGHQPLLKGGPAATVTVNLLQPEGGNPLFKADGQHPEPAKSMNDGKSRT